MRTIQKTVYEYEELSEQAKERARDEYIEEALSGQEFYENGEAA